MVKSFQQDGTQNSSYISTTDPSNLGTPKAVHLSVVSCSFNIYAVFSAAKIMRLPILPVSLANIWSFVGRFVSLLHQSFELKPRCLYPVLSVANIQRIIFLFKKLDLCLSVK